MDKNILIIYHKEDNDGVFSGAIIYNYLIRNNLATPEQIVRLGTEYSMLHDIYEEGNWQEYFSPEKYEKIFLTDVSFNDIEVMMWLHKTYGNNFVWFDHHYPAIKASFENKYDGVEGVRLRDRSAIGCVWRYFYDPFDADWLTRKEYIVDRKGEPGPYPELLRMLSAYDSWTYKECGYNFNYCYCVNKGVTEHINLDFDTTLYEVDTCVEIMNTYSVQETLKEKDEWFSWQRDDLTFYFEIGLQLKIAEDRRWKNIIENMGDVNFKLRDEDKEYKAVMIFTSEGTNSRCFESVKELYPEVRFGIAIKHNGKAKQKPYTMSLYDIYGDDTNDFHCGDFLKKKYEGGGHKGAAGCQLSPEMFYMIMDNKCI